MSEPATPERPFYVTGGTLKPGEPSYVERRADAELYESLLAGEFCYILTARQMGKSSLMARTAKRLEQAGVASAIVDLTQIGSERGDQAAAQWYFGIANVIHRQLGIAEPLRAWWQERADLSSVQRLTDFFRELVLPNVPGRVVVFVDEIDSTIGLPFADDFFAALRACFNVRATDDDFERLTFVLLGVATPDQLIRAPARTPFNIGRRIELTDFRPDEAQVLAPGLHSDAGQAGRRLERVLHWTGGHPYLTQAVCRAVREKGDTGTAEEVVDPQVEEMFLSSRAQREETNLKHARARLERRGSEGRRLLQLYRRVRQGKSVPDQPTSPLFAQLKLAGVVKATEDGRLAVRNRIYETVFTPEWVKAAMPADRGRQLAAATLALAFASVLIWYAVFQPRPYEEALQAAIRDDAYNVAFEAYSALRSNPFSRSRATELMQEFWEQRGLRYALDGKRDESLLCYLKGVELKDNERLRRQARNLVGSDYERLRLTLRHVDGVSAMAFSPNGRTIATSAGGFFFSSSTAPERGTVQLWDASSGKRIDFFVEYREGVGELDFSPNGRILATASIDSTARLWDARSGKPFASPFKHQDIVSGIAFSPDGKIVATGAFDETARLWDASTGKLISPPLQHQGDVHAVAFSPDGRTLVTGSGGFDGHGAAQLWDARTGKLLALPVKHLGDVYAVAVSPDGRTFATGSYDETARLWDARTGQPIGPPLKHQGSVFRVTFSPDGGTLATSSSDDSAQLWDARTGKPLAPPFRHQDNVEALAFSPDSRVVGTGSHDQTARLWDARTEAPRAPRFQYESAGNSVALSPDAGIFATWPVDKSVRLWDTRTGRVLVLSTQHGYAVESVAFSPDSRTLATASDDHAARLWNILTGEPLGPPLKHGDSIAALAFSPDGQTLATGSGSTARLWDTRTRELRVPPLEHEGAIVALVFKSDGRTLVTGAESTFRIWDVLSGKPLSPLLKHDGAIAALAISSDGRTLATGTIDDTRLWDTRTGKLLGPPLEQQGRVRTIAFSSSGNDLFVATDHWMNTYSWDGKRAIPQSSQLLHGIWRSGFSFPSDCERCLQVALGDANNSFHLETLQLDGPTDLPIEGDPKELLEKWQARLGLKFDEQMKPVPRY